MGIYRRRDVSGQGNQDVRAGQRRGDRIRGAEQTINGPGLASHLGGGPSGQHSDEAERGHELACPEKPWRFEETSLEPQPPARREQAQHDEADPDHDPEREERDSYRRAILPGESFKPHKGYIWKLRSRFPALRLEQEPGSLAFPPISVHGTIPDGVPVRDVQCDEYAGLGSSGIEPRELKFRQSDARGQHTSTATIWTQALLLSAGQRGRLPWNALKRALS